ncbi:hypothetical protein HYN59_01645 [Flavobacterium album]|uniref:DUF7948 domain-containing protein n=1 Tax=Flavobacterium album TaxID=2175091 RepID=A0A2S1QTZ9_9FLAO|nr:hypothetical protein [Flavobacterium album]AWH83898.1 hypothetical protein HYN59_01645 [Flavobacterium album]
MNKTIILFFLFAIHNLYSQESLKDNSVGFVENKGQIINQDNKINKEVCYLLATPGLNVQLRKTGFSYDFYEASKKSAAIKSTNKNFIGADYPVFDEISNYKIHRVDFDFQNINPNSKIIALGKCEGYDNFYNLPYSGGVTNVFKYKEILYKDIYKNIDLHFFIPEDRSKPVEYNFIIHEGGNIDDIKFRISGAKTQLDGNSIKIKLRFGEMKETIPLSWTEGDTREPISINYRNISKNSYGLAFAGATPVSKKIIIDPVPVRIWGSYFGGNETAFPYKATSDLSNNFYIIGSTSSATNIATSGAHQSTMIGDSDGYIVKFDTNGQRVWGTYYPVIPADIVTDSQLNVIFCGATNSSSNNITSPGSYQEVKNPTYSDMFAVKLNSSGIRVWGTFYGGIGGESCYSLDVDDNNDDIYLGGGSGSLQNVASPGSYQEVFGGDADGLLVKFSPGGQRIWATYFGGHKPMRL